MTPPGPRFDTTPHPSTRYCHGTAGTPGSAGGTTCSCAMPGALEDLATLRAGESNIILADVDAETDLAVLRRFPHLRKLYIGDVTPAQLGALRGLVAVEELSVNILAQGHPVGLAPFAGMKNLRVLGISLDRVEGRSDPVIDLEPLTSLTNLRVLSLQDMRMPTLAPLGNLTKLERLGLTCRGAIDLSPLQQLAALHEVVLNVGCSPEVRDVLDERVAISKSAGGGICDIDPVACGPRNCAGERAHR